MNPSSHQGAKFETRDINFPVLVALAVLLFLIIIGAHLLSAGMDRGLKRAAVWGVPQPMAMEDLHRLPPEPRLQENPTADLIRLRAEEEAKLSGYGFIPGQEGRAHIPIERAMAIVAERGAAAPETKEKAR